MVVRDQTHNNTRDKGAHLKSDITPVENQSSNSILSATEKDDNNTLKNVNNTNTVEKNSHIKGKKNLNIDLPHDTDTNIETQFQNQIQSQLQNQLQNELNQTFNEQSSEDNHNVDKNNINKYNINNNISNNSNNSINNNNHNNILDSTNIDDELRNLESIANDITKNAVDDAAAAVVSFAQAATANRLDDDDDVVNGDIDVNIANIDTNLDDTQSQNKINDDLTHVLKGRVFYLPIESSDNENIKSMVFSYGGKIVNNVGKNVFTLIPGEEKLLSDIDNQYSYQLIYDTYLKRSLQDLKKYRLDGSSLNNNDHNNVGDITDDNNDSTKNSNNNSNDNLTVNSENVANGIESHESLRINVGDFPIVKPSSIEDESTLIGNDSKAKRRVIKNPNPEIKRKSKKFTREEDEFILDLVRRNPHLRSTHTFFARISQLEPLSEHTGNSIRYRYRKVLAPTLNYVYKIDPATGKPEIDPETDQPYQITEIPSLIKSQYTSEEDYSLCKHILAYKSGEMVLYGKKKHEISQIPEVVFQELNKTNPRHSTMSWRDRYRKFAAKFGLRRYIDYYEDCITRDIIPEPMKNMSSRADRKDYKVDVFENENKRTSDAEHVPVKKIKTGIEKQSSKAKIRATKAKLSKNNKALDGINLRDDESKTKDKSLDDNLVDPLLTSESVSAAAGALKALASVSLEQSKVDDEGNAEDKLSDKISKDSNISVNGEASKHNEDDGANLFVDATEDEMKQYDIALNNAGIDTDSKSKTKQNSIEEEEEVATAENDNVNDAEVELVNIKADDGLMDFRQLIEIDPEPLKHRDKIDLDTMVRNIHECFRNFGDRNTPYELFKDISDQTGISMLWLNYWFDCSCGMLGTFIQAIIHYLETGELIMNQVSGFWTEKDDELLKMDPENKELLQLHGKDSVTKRKAVLFSYVL
jgi:hypothetical protein